MSANSYDELPYADYCFALTHPEHLFAVSSLCGRRAPAFARSRVLELGCARGANLIPMALDLPESTFVGVDLSEKQVDEANARVTALRLTNVSFRATSIADLGADIGSFDYVLCHGVYSWVPAHVKDAILRVCRAHLNPDGVAYVSFNALPGWNALRTIRDFLSMHVPEGPALERLERARRALAMLREAVRVENTPWGRFLRDELDAIAEAEDTYLFHEYFETVNDAVYLTDFVRHARAHGLDHLADADLTIASHALRPSPGDPIALAQSVDFAENRRFRAALLVRAETIAGPADAANLAHLYLGTRAELTRDVSDRELRDDSEIAFVVGDERVEPRNPWIKCALAELASRARRPMSYSALSSAVGKRLGVDRVRALSLAAAHAADVLELLYDGTLELRASEARYAEEAGLRPVASPLARMQSSREALVTTYRHGRIEAPAFARTLLPLLDGTRDRAALYAALHDGSPSIAGRVEEALEWCARNALLR